MLGLLGLGLFYLLGEVHTVTEGQQGIFKAHFPKETMHVWLSILPSSSSSATCQPVSTTSERAVEVSKTLTLWLSE